MYFPLFYRLFIPKVKFLTAFLSFFFILVLGISSINIFIIPVNATLLRMMLPEIVIFIWICFCFDDAVDFKVFGCLSSILITYVAEVSCMIIFYALTGQRLIELSNEPITFLILRISAIIENLGAYEIFIYIMRKYNIKKVPYFSIVMPILIMMCLIGNCIQNLATYDDIERMIETVIFTVFTSILLLFWILKVIHTEFKKKSILVLQNEIEQQYQILLEDYLNIADSDLLQKYLRHDILNHLEVLEKMEKEQKIIEMDETSNKINP